MSKVAVIIPCFRVKKHVIDVIARVPAMVDRIYVVDDACPEKSGEHVKAQVRDPRVHVIFLEKNQGVGGAMVAGYQRAIDDGYDVAVKVDGDGQMNPALVPRFVEPILEGRADYTKGNRFYRLSSLKKMPSTRLFGNSLLSFWTKLVTGYWQTMDPTNGYTAIHTAILKELSLSRIEKRYFFETDMLFQLGYFRAAVVDIPMEAVYADEQSSLRIMTVLRTFPPKYLVRLFQRVFYEYFVREFNVATVELVAGMGLISFGLIYGVQHWIRAYLTQTQTAIGVVMAAALPTIVGFQMLIAFINYDVGHIPRSAVWKLLGKS